MYDVTRRPLVRIASLSLLALACGSKRPPAASASNQTDGGGTGGGPRSPVPAAGAPIAPQADAPPTILPPLPGMTNVIALQREDSVGIDFDPVDNAIDYRVYPLPMDGDIKVNSDGSVTVKNAIYRCAGLRQANDLPNDTTNPLKAPDKVYNQQFPWGAKIGPNPALGFVYLTPASDRLPVYAVGIHPSGDEQGWTETRPKIYTTDQGLRKMMLDQGARDDGIVFYVPATASSATSTVYHSEAATPIAGQNWTSYAEYYFLGSDTGSHAKDSVAPAPAFEVLNAAAQGTKPLMRVEYQPGQRHDELAPGLERFNRAANQGPGPLWHLEWAGLTQETTLVIEALSSGCPFQGFLSAQPLSAPPHQTFFTLDQLQQASQTGEVYINGQYDLPGTLDAGVPLLATPNSSPVPIARSFVKVKPQPHNPADWDWYQGFLVGTSFDATASPDPALDQWSVHYTSSAFDFGAYSLDRPKALVFTYGQFLGQFWDAFDDTAHDVTGRVRLTAQQQTSISSDPTKYLHVTWTVNSVGTDRRYPQLIVSDQQAPVENGFKNASGNFLIIQTIRGPSMRFDVEAFHGLIQNKPWAVNNQAHAHSLIDYDTWNSGVSTNATIPPSVPLFDHTGMDRMTKYDAYVSANLLYTFVDGVPAGCTKYPSNGFALKGPVTVTFGDVLYHEGAYDEGVCQKPRPYAFMHEHECIETKRHWDDLAFKAGVLAPAWDETKFPCTVF